MILLKNGIYIDWQTLEFINSDVLVEEGKHGKIRLLPKGITTEKAETLDCSGRFVTKSFANGHHHVYSALARGMSVPEKYPKNFPEILQYIWWRLDRSLDLDMIRSSALVTAIACAKNGVTYVIDHHASPFAVNGSLETIAQAFDEVGVSHLLCYEITDRDGKEIAQQGFYETADFLSKRDGLVGLHASFTVGEDTLKQAVGLAQQTKTGIHVHIAEDKSDEDHCEKIYKQRVIERFADAGALQFPKTILGHCIHLDQHERELVRKSPSWIVQNTESNLNNKVGNFTGEGLGRNIMIGTDGMHSDVPKSAKTAFFSGHNFEEIGYSETYRRFRNVHHYLNSNGFAGDGENNLVVLDYDSPTPFTSENFFGHFIFGIESRHVRDVITSGKLIVKNREILTVNEQEILEESRRQAKRLWERMLKQK